MAKNDSYFLKDKKAMIYKEVDTDEGTYYVAQAASDLWCYAKQLSQDQVFMASAYNREETRYFVFNHIDFVDIYDLILYRGAWYEVTRIDTKDDYNGETFIYVKEAKIGGTPSEDQLKDYGWEP